MAVQYFSEQRGVRKQYDLPELRKQLKGIYNYFEAQKYFAEWAGYACVDARNGWAAGTAGDDIGAAVFVAVERDDLYPIDPTGENTYQPWSEDQVFDMVQFLGTVISKPTETYYHSWNECGHHPTAFDRQAGLDEYRAMVNRALARYGDGWELRDDLSIAELPPNGMTTLVAATVPPSLDVESRRRVEAAVEKYRRRGATRGDRRDAVRDLGDVLERYRQQAKTILGKTESDLFNILNNFDIRHNNELQKADYDSIFMSGLFYHYLNMIHVLAHMLERRQKNAAES